jgi:predicted HTH transcriptional regulator
MNAESPIGQVLLNLRLFVDELALTEDVLKVLLPYGAPHQFESELWDYKEKLPTLPSKASDDDQKKYKAEIGDVIKDIVAFHNSYGGYIVFGVANKGKNRVRGCDFDFDIGDLNKRVQGYTVNRPGFAGGSNS